MRQPTIAALEGSIVAVFEYRALLNKQRMSGTVIAEDRIRAFDKLKRLRYDEIHLRQIKGIGAFIRQFSADVK